jgi:hypothetical protein
VPRPPGRPKPVTGAVVQQAVQRTVAEARAASPVLRREAEALLAVIERHKANISAGFYEIGRALTQLLDRHLYRQLGYATFAAMVEERKLMSRAFAWQLVAIYRSLPREAAQQLGPSRAFEWLRVLRLQAGPEAEAEDVRKLAGEQPAVAGRSIVELSVSEIAELRRRSQARRDAASHDPGAAAAHRTARSLAQYLQHIGAEDARVSARFARGAWRIHLVLGVESAQAVYGKK